MRKYQTLFIALTAAVFAMTFFVDASSSAFMGLCCSHCGGNMPLNIVGAGIPEPGELRVKPSQAFMRMNGLRNRASDLSASDLLGMPSMGKYMAAPESMDMHDSMLGVAYSFTDDFALMAMFMGTVKRMPMKFSSMMRMSAGASGFTMKSDGLNDTMILGKYRLYANYTMAPTSQFSLLFGADIPTGSIDEKLTNHPVEANNGRILPFGMQLGTGTVDPIIGVSYQGSHAPFWYGTTFRYTGRWYDNHRGYHQGQELNYDLYAMYQASVGTVLTLQINGKWLGKYSAEPDSERENGDGHVDFDPARGFVSPLYDPNNYGGSKLYVTAGIQFQPIPLHIMELDFQVPIYQNLNGPQLKEGFRVQFTYYIEYPTRKSRRYIGARSATEFGF